jgi:20S proteasome alpha/beta subunit
MPVDKRPLVVFVVAGITNSQTKVLRLGPGKLYTLVSAADFPPYLATGPYALGGIVNYAVYLLHRLYDEGMTCGQLAPLCVHVIGETASQDGRVGGPTKLATVTKDKGFVFVEDGRVAEIETSLRKQNEQMRTFFLNGGIEGK